jgi:hypothetical protein
MLSENQIIFFKDNGYLVVEPEVIYNYKELYELNNICEKNFLNYEDGFLEQNIKKYNSKEFSIVHENIKYFQNGATNDKNILNARRAVYMGYQINHGLSKYIENHNLQSCVKKLLNTKKISLHTSSLTKVYPGCIGEPKKLHTDLPGFVNNPLSFVKKKGFVLNVIIYLNDVDENLAPIRISPKTNLNYLDINNYLRLKKNIKKNINLVHASDIGVDEKIILDLKYEIKKIQGKKGTVIFFSSNTLHSATENKTNKSRIHLNFNFGRREDLEVRKFNYKLMKNENINIYNYVNNFNDKKILQRSYIDSFKNKFLNKYYEYYSKIENMIND